VLTEASQGKVAKLAVVQAGREKDKPLLLEFPFQTVLARDSAFDKLPHARFAPHLQRLSALQSAAHTNNIRSVAAALAESKTSELLPALQSAAVAGHALVVKTVLDAEQFTKDQVGRCLLIVA
jgi:hypothetical protein